MLKEKSLVRLLIYSVIMFLIFIGFCHLVMWGFRVEERKQQQKFEAFKTIESELKKERQVRVAAFRETKLSDEMIVRGIIGEAIGEPAQGIIAVAWVMRNRLDSGMSAGFCALNRENLNFFIWRQPQWKKDLVKDIWSKVKTGQISDPTKGAKYFENVNAFGKPPWINQVEYVLTIGQHNFYK